MRKYKILVKTLQSRILTYTVEDYTISNGYIGFTDRVTGIFKKFAVSNTEIEEISGDYNGGN